MTVGDLKPLTGSILVSDYDARWPELFEQEATRVRAALGPRVKLLEHVGSTSVPGLAAKPVIDMVLAVADAADESSYAPMLEAEWKFVQNYADAKTGVVQEILAKARAAKEPGPG